MRRAVPSEKEPYVLFHSESVPSAADSAVEPDAPGAEEAERSVVEPSATSEPESIVPESNESATVPEAEPEPETQQKVDVAPAEIFAALEALYAGAAVTDANAVNTQISALSRINLPRKLNAVFPELSTAASQCDYTRIKAVIDSLRTGTRAS